MKIEYLHKNLLYTLLLAILAGRCHCNKERTTQAPSKDIPTLQKQPALSENLEEPEELLPTADDVWHVGNYVRDVTPADYHNDWTKALGVHTYKMYRVKHNGSCGFRAFIPVMLEQLLADSSWKSWIEDIHDTVFKKAEQILKSHQLRDTSYQALAPTDNPEALYQCVRNLLVTLSKEKASRKLQETEIQTLVDFLRQIALMQEVSKHAETGNLKAELEAFYKRHQAHTYGKEWWTDDSTLLSLKLPLIIVFGPGKEENYYHLRYSNGGLTHCYVLRDWKTIDSKIFPQKRKVLIHHHSDVYFDYWIRQ